MSEENLFANATPPQGETPPTSGQTPPPVQDPTPPPAPPAYTAELGAILNPDGTQKYRDVPTALDALRHSQEYIKKLQDEKAEAETKATTMAELMEALKKEAPPAVPPVPQNLPPALTAGDVETILLQHEQKKIAAQNAKVVTDAFQRLYGEKASEVFYAKAQELGMAPAAINQLAANSPQAVLTMLQANQKATPPVPHSSVNNLGTPPAPPKAIGSVMGFVSTNQLTGAFRDMSKQIYAKHNQ